MFIPGDAEGSIAGVTGVMSLSPAWASYTLSVNASGMRRGRGIPTP